jgi:FkbM family methyltransferase
MELKLALVGAHEYDVNRFLSRHLRPQDIFVDVGANIGYHALIAGRRVRDGRVIAFEPSPSNLLALDDNMALNPLCNITVVRKAAWRETGRSLPLHVRDPFNYGAISILGEGSVEGTADTTTVDDALEECGVVRADIVKIDAEGAELDVILGMARCLARLRPRFVICALDHPEEGVRRAAYEAITSRGYEEIDAVEDAPRLRTAFGRANVFFRAVRRPSEDDALPRARSTSGRSGWTGGHHAFGSLRGHDAGGGEEGTLEFTVEPPSAALQAQRHGSMAAFTRRSG